MFPSLLFFEQPEHLNLSYGGLIIVSIVNRNHDDGCRTCHCCKAQPAEIHVTEFSICIKFSIILTDTLS